MKTEKLDDLVVSIISELQQYDKSIDKEFESTKEIVKEYALQMDNLTNIGEKAIWKQKILKQIGLKPENYEVRISLPKLPLNLLFLMSIGIKDLSSVIGRCPSLIARDYRTCLQPNYIQMQDEIGLTQGDLVKIITKHPRLVTAPPDDIKEHRVYLQNLKFSKKQMRKAVKSVPNVLMYNIESQMQPRVNYVRSFSLDSIETAIVLSECASIFGYAMIRADTEFGLEIPKVEMYLKFLKKLKPPDIEMNDKELLLKKPGLINLNIEYNLEPTADYLTSAYRASNQDIWNNLNILGLILKKRLKPRYEFLKSRGREKDYRIARILNPSDKIFCSILGCSVSKYQEFKEKYIMEQKF